MWVLIYWYKGRRKVRAYTGQEAKDRARLDYVAAVRADLTRIPSAELIGPEDVEFYPSDDEKYHSWAWARLDSDLDL